MNIIEEKFAITKEKLEFCIETTNIIMTIAFQIFDNRLNNFLGLINA